MKTKFQILIILIISVFSCTNQNKKQEKMITDSSNNNPLFCDPVSGVCEIPNNNSTKELITEATEKPIKVIYFTDPICSSCWGIEPQLRKLKLEYGNAVEIEYRMGGLLPDWNYSGGGINKPSDVAHHWDEASRYYEMPIDGDVWLEDPLNSSYPPSIAFKAAQLQSEEKAVLFMRELREMVFLHKKNISKWQNIINAAKNVELDLDQLQKDYENKAQILFAEDLKLAKEYGVRGFPTMFFVDNKGNNEMVYGSQPYSSYESATLSIFPTVKKEEYSKDWESLFRNFNSLTLKEFSELSNMGKSESEKLLDELYSKEKLKKVTTKNGSLWIINLTEI
jgi:predicted DsbA family dithiol-disulfide isomerase